MNPVIPFRWNIAKENELGSLIQGAAAPFPPEFREALLHSAARMLALAGNAELYFVGRSPENYFDLLCGLYHDQPHICQRFHLFQFSARSYPLADLITHYPEHLVSLKTYMHNLGLSPRQIIAREYATALCDLVSEGNTFQRLLGILLQWGEELHADMPALRNKLRIAGITWRTKNSPNTWRWQQQPEWAETLKNITVRNVSIDGGLWSYLGNEQPKTTRSFSPSRWLDPEAENPVHQEQQLEGLRTALWVFRFGKEDSTRQRFRSYLIAQPQMRYPWFRKYVNP